MNAKNEQFQMERVNNVAAQALAQGQQEPHLLINKMIDAVHQFVGDAEQSDDLTMMAIQYIKQQSEVKMQKSIVLPNDIREVPQLNAFVEEVCKTVGYDESVQFMQFTLIHTFLPIDIKDTLGNDRNLVHFIGIESNDAQAYEVGDIFYALVFCPFQFQFSCQ